MTKFWRDGFWRTSANGIEHWVSGHWVEREDWSRTGYPEGSRESVHGILHSLRATGSATACYVNPNANCPVCGAEVFFYQNENGSRVYFDELGPPWPKHPCMDQQSPRAALAVARSNSHDSVFPHARSDGIVRIISGQNATHGIDPDYGFSLKYGAGRWSAYKIARRLRIRGGTALVLLNVERKKPKRRYVFRPRLPQALQDGRLVFEHRNWIAYFDDVQMTPCEIEFQRLAGAKAFLDELVGEESE